MPRLFFLPSIAHPHTGANLKRTHPAQRQSGLNSTDVIGIAVT
ncbi:MULTISPECIES: hypothetical protein [Xanthomonas]|nr:MULTISPECIES: hypothetical protein [Xanthomonas]MCW3193879.1 hypothetical protein [Xanthomonas citri pv. fuscans]